MRDKFTLDFSVDYYFVKYVICDFFSFVTCVMSNMEVKSANILSRFYKCLSCGCRIKMFVPEN